MNRRSFFTRLLAFSSLPAALKAAEGVQRPEIEPLLSGRALELQSKADWYKLHSPVLHMTNWTNDNSLPIMGIRYDDGTTVPIR